METAAALRSFHCSAGSISQTWTSQEKLITWPTSIRCPAFSSSVRPGGTIVSCSKKPEANVLSNSNDMLGVPNGSAKKHVLRTATFQSAFQALVTEVCDETSVAELQLKIGDFEMHMKRNIGTPSAPIVAAPSVPAEPVVQPAPASPSTSAPKASPEKPNPFSAFGAVSSKLARLEASRIAGYKLVPSPTVGSFTRGRTVKGKKQPPICKQGDVIKEGQVIGYVDQFGAELPVRSDVAGEILKVLFDEGEAVGYGDPLVAILPRFS